MKYDLAQDVDDAQPGMMNLSSHLANAGIAQGGMAEDLADNFHVERIRVRILSRQNRHTQGSASSLVSIIFSKFLRTPTGFS